jgi:hypothetical protein
MQSEAFVMLDIYTNINASYLYYFILILMGTIKCLIQFFLLNNQI